jgi:uncharacterized protein YdhG (YjbR/CyaY superfamily)
MERKKSGFVSIDEYISVFPPGTQKTLEELRATIKSAAPEASEKISYQIPTFYLNGNLVHFAAFRDHISFFPGSIANIEKEFGNEIAEYMTGKGTLQFPIDKPIPLDLVSRITRYRAEQNLKMIKGRAVKK